MSTLRPRIGGAFLTIACALTFAGPITQAPARPVAPIAQTSCKRAIIVHQHKCIARGQFCKHTRRANRDYHRYGYHCGKRDRNGRYHLVYY
jgi:hypothetical protein